MSSSRSSSGSIAIRATISRCTGAIVAGDTSRNRVPSLAIFALKILSVVRILDLAQRQPWVRRALAGDDLTTLQINDSKCIRLIFVHEIARAFTK